MRTARRNSRQPRYRTVFPDWSGPRPVDWFFGENLLEARAASSFPTNGDGHDEEINVYLSQLLSGWLGGATDPRVATGATPRLEPPAKSLSRRERAQWYRVNGDHRLLGLGLFGCGDVQRRRVVPWGEDRTEARRRDLATGRLCYELAANLLTGRAGALGHLAGVLARLAEHFEDYAHVLAVLATRRFGLGAVLGEGELAGLAREPRPAAAVADAAPPRMDDLLDALLEQRRSPEPDRQVRIDDLARRLGVDPIQR